MALRGVLQIEGRPVFLHHLLKARRKVQLIQNGVVHNSAYRFLAAKRVIQCAVENGFDCLGLIPSPIEGGDGNKEYLAYFVKKSCIKPRVDDKQIKRITLM